MKRAIYPGSFDPITYGHLDIIERSSKMFDQVIVAVLNNSQKNSLFSTTVRVSMISGLVASYENVTVESFDGLLVDFAEKKDANIIVRGLRAVTDFEYELQIAQTNRTISPSLDTVFLVTSLNYSYLSSTMVKEIASYGGDISRFVPPEIEQQIKEQFK
ncbi:MAG: pantetheine-phosphate adenylyltransferase [Lachnospiraceae bacterium]|nr:pantetheine-phosphate adenylyltransferase [Lachnospiraceae bacterium]